MLVGMMFTPLSASTAKILNALRNEWEVVLNLFSSLRRKISGGASKMIEEGVLQNPQLINYWSICFPELKAGVIGMKTVCLWLLQMNYTLP